MTIAYLKDIPELEIKKLLEDLESEKIADTKQPILTLGEVVTIGENSNILAYKVQFDNDAALERLISKFYTDYGHFEDAQVARAERENINLQKNNLPECCHITIGKKDTLESQGITKEALAARIGESLKGICVDIKPLGNFSPIAHQNYMFQQ